MFNQSLQTATGYFHSVPVDIIVLAVFLIVCTFFAFQFGKRVALALVLAVYPALILFSVFPFAWTSLAPGAMQTAYASTALFCVLWGGAFFFMRRFIVSSYPLRRFTRFIEALALGIIVSGTTVAAAYHIGTLPQLYAFSSQISMLFSGGLPFFLWLLSPFIGMLLFIRA